MKSLVLFMLLASNAYGASSVFVADSRTSHYTKCVKTKIADRAYMTSSICAPKCASFRGVAVCKVEKDLTGTASVLAETAPALDSSLSIMNFDCKSKAAKADMTMKVSDLSFVAKPEMVAVGNGSGRVDYEKACYLNGGELASAGGKVYAVKTLRQYDGFFVGEPVFTQRHL